VVARRLVAASLALAVSVLALGRPGLAADDAVGPSVEAVQAAVNAENVGASAKTFADDAVVIVPRLGGLPQIYVGLGRLRWWLSSLAAQHAHLVRTGWPRLDGNHVRWSDAFSADAFRQIGLA
jgi:hypothetical protein